MPRSERKPPARILDGMNALLFVVNFGLELAQHKNMYSFLFIDTERVWRGGQEQLFTLARGLRQRGHEVHLIHQPNSALGDRAGKIGVFLHPLAVRSEIGLISLLRLYSIIKRVRPDVLGFNTPKPILIGVLASRFTSAGVRIIFRRVDFPLGRSFFSRLKYTWGIDGIITISESIRSRLRSAGAPASKITTIYEGIDLSLYPESGQTQQALPASPAVVGVVSHLSREKGISFLVEAAALIPEVKKKYRFVIVGEGACLQELTQLVKEKDLEQIFQFTGFRSDIPQLMKSFSIFALPSLSEGLSSAILEAMASSLPIVASNVGGIPELVKDGENGLLVAPADADALASALQKLAENPEERFRMGQTNRRQAVEKFTMEQKILKTEELCTSLLLERRRLARKNQ
jgi:glycosyltransferase involved in cell wall biosynthesis